MATAGRDVEAIGIAVFARAPVAGQCKTRLIPALGAEGAAALHRRMIRRTIACALAAATGPVSLWCAPDASHPALVAAGGDGRVELRTQADGDLGARMLAAFQAQTSGSPLMLIGTDCPALTPSLLRDCAACLRDGDDAVFLPTEDGGYVLVGTRRPQPDLFNDMPWSTERVMAETRRRLQAAVLRWREPATLWDVDTPADLDRLRVSGLMRVR
ncbi:MAG TPA: TIGR04282 family arsenosugar biosynthesis glycosyltransferase [Vineibacter sp.]|nr:TIGR04282 family arsenosugar biosynthesis glycosyltransferase [Vineibacter sp.]